MRSPLARFALALMTALAAPTAAGCAIHTRGPGLVAEGGAPSFTLTDQRGGQTSFASLTQGGAAVLVFYRGYW